MLTAVIGLVLFREVAACASYCVDLRAGTPKAVQVDGKIVVALNCGIKTEREQESGEHIKTAQCQKERKEYRLGKR